MRPHTLLYIYCAGTTLAFVWIFASIGRMISAAVIIFAIQKLDRKVKGVGFRVGGDLL